MRRILPQGMRLRWEVRRIYRLYDRKIPAAKGWREEQALVEEMSAELERPRAELDAWETRRWVRLALRYNVRQPPMPIGEDGNEYWEYNRYGSRYVLTDDGKAEIRLKLREEWGWRREQRTAWLAALGQFLPAATGFIGALIGLAALLATLFR